MSVTSVRINHELQPLIDEYVHEQHRSKNWLINEALRNFFEMKQIQEERSQAVLHGLADAKAGHVVDGDKVDAWLASWGTDHESDEP